MRVWFLLGFRPLTVFFLSALNASLCVCVVFAWISSSMFYRAAKTLLADTCVVSRPQFELYSIKWVSNEKELFLGDLFVFNGSCDRFVHTTRFHEYGHCCLFVSAQQFILPREVRIFCQAKRSLAYTYRAWACLMLSPGIHIDLANLDETIAKSFFTHYTSEGIWHFTGKSVMLAT